MGNDIVMIKMRVYYNYNRMDLSRMMLDNLMGRDRNLPKNSIHNRDHYSNSDVCKPFLVCFCFNTLFPNTIYDEGPCNKRHDTYLKTMFDNDLLRGDYEKVYIKECVTWIQRRLQEAEQKTKKNQNTIESKTSLSTQRPRQILDRILAIDKDIEEMMKKAQIFGENGQIDDSARCLQEVERLRDRRKEIDLMGDNLLAVVKQQKICQICGAIQTINDTEKRIQMHLQGKIHQGFLKLRTQIETLKIRLEIIQQKIEKNREKAQALLPPITPSNNSEAKSKENQRNEERQRERQKEKEKQRQKQRQKEKEKEKQKEKEKEKEREKAKDLQRQKPSHKDKEKEREREREDSHHSKKKKKEHKHKEERKDSRDRKKKDRSIQKKSIQGDKKKQRHDRDQNAKKSKKKRDHSRSPEKEYRRQRERSRERDYRSYRND